MRTAIRYPWQLAIGLLLTGGLLLEKAHQGVAHQLSGIADLFQGISMGPQFNEQRAGREIHIVLAVAEKDGAGPHSEVI